MPLQCLSLQCLSLQCISFDKRQAVPLPTYLVPTTPCTTFEPRNTDLVLVRSAFDLGDRSVSGVRELERQRHVALASAIPDIAESHVIDGPRASATTRAPGRDTVGATCSVCGLQCN